VRRNLRNLHAESQYCSSYSFRDLSVHPDRQTDGHGKIDSASDPDQECIYFMGPKTLPSACYILSDESSIPFYSTSNGYKNVYKTRKNAIVEYLDKQIPVTQLMGPKGNGDMQAAKRDWNAPPTRDLNIWLCGR